MGTGTTKIAKSANGCPINLFATFFEHGLGYPSNVRVFDSAVFKPSIDASIQKTDELMRQFDAFVSASDASEESIIVQSSRLGLAFFLFGPCIFH